MVYIYRSKPSAGAVELARLIGGRKVRHPPRVGPGDVVISWGERLEGAVNGSPLKSKYTDALTLRAAGVPTIEVALTGPIPHEERLFWPTTTGLVRSQVLELQRQIAEWLAVPAPGEWLGRLNSHVGGNDLLNPPGVADYYVKKETLVREYRVHSFAGVSIRGGQKIPRTGIEAPHEWIRSWDGGWRISYDGRALRERHREVAHSAITALGLTFGAVDIGERADRTLLVLEVNRAPGLEGGTIAAYAQAIQRLIGENHENTRVEEASQGESQ